MRGGLHAHGLELLWHRERAGRVSGRDERERLPVQESERVRDVQRDRDLDVLSSSGKVIFSLHQRSKERAGKCRPFHLRRRSTRDGVIARASPVAQLAKREHNDNGAPRKRLYREPYRGAAVKGGSRPMLRAIARLLRQIEHV